MTFEKDLIVLTADRKIEYAIRGILSRFQFSKIDFDINNHRRFDAGCYLEGVEYLRAFLKSHEKAMIVFDRKGCGNDSAARESIESEVETNFDRNGWKNRSTAIVFDPEVEIWVWNKSPVVESTLGWTDQETSMREWLKNKGFAISKDGKPEKPKDALKAVVRKTRLAKASSIYQQLGQKVSLERCVDPSFLKFKSKLQEWFPAKGKSSKA